MLPATCQIKKNDYCIIETKHGLDFAQCIVPLNSLNKKSCCTISPSNLSSSLSSEDQKIKFYEDFFEFRRIATEKDFELFKRENLKIPFYRKIAEEKIKELKMPIKLGAIYPFFEGEKVIFHFFAEEKKVDFRNLLKALASSLHLRIELHKVGIKNFMEVLDEIGYCGRKTCCSSFKPHKFEKKIQGLQEVPYANGALGLCGKQKCCQRF
jgi:cell fate regulator YaaT (PSP1 superfamily)